MNSPQVVEVPYQHRKGERIVCEVCPVHCKLKEGQTGICRGRKVENDTLIATNYGRVVSHHKDPIEKKPLYHFLPAEWIMSAGPNGCNFHCPWCQNCDISQFEVPTRYYGPEKLAELAVEDRSVGLAYTYAEPMIWFETVRDTAPLVREKGGVNVLVTNGYVEKEPLRELLPVIDAANVDLKFTDPELYRKHAGGDLERVKWSIEEMHGAGVHVEVTHLMVTGLTSPGEVGGLAEWLAGVSPDIPLHLSRYYPRHKWQEPPTKLSTLEQAVSEARNHLHFVFLGNVGGEADTVCPGCGSRAIRRGGWDVDPSGVDEAGRCTACGRDLGVRRTTASRA